MTVAEIAIRAQPLPEVIILTGSGLGGLLGAIVGVMRGSDLDAIARQSLIGTVWGRIILGFVFIAVLLVGIG